MSFLLWFTVFTGLFLGFSGCMKTIEIKPAAPVGAPKERIVMEAPDDAPVPEATPGRRRQPESDAGINAQILLAVGGQYEAAGEEEQALRHFDRAAEAFAGLQDRSGEALAFSRKFLLLLQVGREDEALALLREASGKWSATPLRAFAGSLEGRYALRRGDFGRARQRLRQSLQDSGDYRKDLHLLQLKRDSELAAGMAAVLADHLPRLQAAYRLPETQGGEGSPVGEGRAHLREALAVNQELKQTKIGPFVPAGDFQKAEAAAYAFLGLDEGMRGDKAVSFLYLHYAVELARAAGDREGEMWGLLFLGEIGVGAEGHVEGLRAAEALRELADRYQAAPYRIWARLLLARYGLEQGRRNEAIGVLQEADGILSIRRAGTEEAMLTRVFRIQRRAVYEFLVDLLAEEGRAGEALTAAEKAKSLLTADLLRGENIGGTPAERMLLEREAELGAASGRLQRRILQITDPVRTGELLERLKGADAAYRELLGRLESDGGRLLPFVSVRSIDSAALQRLLDEDTTLFAYFATDRGLYAWAVHRNAVHLARIDLPRMELRKFVFAYLDAVRSKNRRQTESLSRKAYDLLLKRVIPFVSGDRIGFIPDDCLAYFPFAAMNYRGKYIVEGFSLFHLPWAGMLEPMTAEKAPSGLRLLVVGDPHLADEKPGLHPAAEEIKQVRKRSGQTTVLLQEQASEAQVREMVAGHDILHFAVRCQLDTDDPLRSHLLLAPGAGQDGALSAREIFRLRYAGRLAVLSGCDTLPGKDPEGWSYSALQRAFIQAGSPSVLSTLWMVNDRAAGRLLDLFYRQAERKKTLSESLRAAQLQLLREGAHPYVWAAFTLTGRH